MYDSRILLKQAKKSTKRCFYSTVKLTPWKLLVSFFVSNLIDSVIIRLCYVSEWLRDWTRGDRSIPWPGHLRVRLRSRDSSNDEHPYEDLLHPMRYRRYGPHHVRVWSATTEVWWYVLPFCQTRSLDKISWHWKHFSLVRNCYHGRYYVRFQIYVLYWLKMAIRYMMFQYFVHTENSI